MLQLRQQKTTSVPILSAKNGHRLPQTGRLNIAWSNESRFLLQHPQQSTQHICVVQCQQTNQTSIGSQVIYVCIILDGYYVSHHAHVRPDTESFQMSVPAASQCSVTHMEESAIYHDWLMIDKREKITPSLPPRQFAFLDLKLCMAEASSKFELENLR